MELREALDVYEEGRMKLVEGIEPEFLFAAGLALARALKLAQQALSEREAVFNAREAVHRARAGDMGLFLQRLRRMMDRAVIAGDKVVAVWKEDLEELLQTPKELWPQATALHENMMARAASGEMLEVHHPQP